MTNHSFPPAGNAYPKALLALGTLVFVIALLLSGDASKSEAAHGGEYHITDVVLHPATVSEPPVTFYQGGYGDCNSYHNVCYFVFQWFHWTGSTSQFRGESYHSTPAGPARWHCHLPISTSNPTCNNDSHGNSRGSAWGLGCGWKFVWAAAAARDGSWLDSDPSGWVYVRNCA